MKKDFFWYVFGFNSSADKPISNQYCGILKIIKAKINLKYAVRDDEYRYLRYIKLRSFRFDAKLPKNCIIKYLTTLEIKETLIKVETTK